MDVKKHPLYLELSSFIHPSHDKEQIIRYLACMYDKRSPYNSISNFFERKAKCAELAKFTVTKGGKFSKKYQSVLNCSEQWFVDLVIRYCQEIADMNWTELVTLTQQYYQIQDILMRPFEADKDKDVVSATKTKIDIAEKSEKMRKLIEDATDRLLASEKNEKLRVYVFKKASLESRNRPALTPEYFAAQN